MKERGGEIRCADRRQDPGRERRGSEAAVLALLGFPSFDEQSALHFDWWCGCAEAASLLEAHGHLSQVVVR